MKNKADLLLEQLSSYELAQIVLEKLECSVLVVGSTGTGKSTLLEKTNIPDSKYFDFCKLSEDTFLSPHMLCESNFTGYKDELINAVEKTLILDLVDLAGDQDVNLLQFIKDAKNYGKRLIVVMHPIDIDIAKPLFGAVITLSGGMREVERTCEVELISQ
ncbi:ATP-binding protein [Providencia rettgeri]